MPCSEKAHLLINDSYGDVVKYPLFSSYPRSCLEFWVSQYERSIQQVKCGQQGDEGSAGKLQGGLSKTLRVLGLEESLPE